MFSSKNECRRTTRSPGARPNLLKSPSTRDARSGAMNVWCFPRQLITDGCLKPLWNIRLGDQEHAAPQQATTDLPAAQESVMPAHRMSRACFDQ